MFCKLSKNSSVKNILVITLSNIGDVVLAAPVLDILLRDFPSAKLSLVIGERPLSLFEGNTRISQRHIFDKTKSWQEQLQWTLDLRRHHYDLVVDLRNTMIGYALTPKWMMPPSMVIKKTVHLKIEHLNRLRTLYDFESDQAMQQAIAPTAADEALVEGLLKRSIGDAPFLMIAPFAADSAKTWIPKEFAGVTQSISKTYPDLKIVMIGSPAQKPAIDEIIKEANVPVLSLAGHVNLIQTAAVIKRAKIVIVHDSGPMHIASYFNKPVVALFGFTDPFFSKPWSSLYKVVRHNSQCPRCQNPRLVDVPHTCMAGITQEHVLDAFAEVYGRI